MKEEVKEEEKEKSNSFIKLNDLFPETYSLERNANQIPEEYNTRLFLLSQQLSNSQPGIKHNHIQYHSLLDLDFIRRILSFDPIPSIPEEYKKQVYKVLLSVVIFFVLINVISRLNMTRFFFSMTCNGKYNYQTKRKSLNVYIAWFLISQWIRWRWQVGNPALDG